MANIQEHMYQSYLLVGSFSLVSSLKTVKTKSLKNTAAENPAGKVIRPVAKVINPAVHPNLHLNLDKTHNNDS